MNSPFKFLRARLVALLSGVLFAPRLSRDDIALANAITDGTHEDSVSRRADAAHTARHLFVKPGSDDDHVALAGAADIAIGTCTDQPSAAEDVVEVKLLGGAKGSRLAVASAAIAVGDFIVSAASGKAKTLPGATGTYYILGRALTAASGDGIPFEFDPCVPIQRVVP